MAAIAAYELAGRRKIKKRKYSRKGCLECKRRKIKCDEASPACYNCTRLNKKCVFPGVQVMMENGEYYGGENSAKTSPEVPLTVKFYQPKRLGSRPGLGLGQVQVPPLTPNDSNGLNEAIRGSSLETEPEMKPKTGTGTATEMEKIEGVENMTDEVFEHDMRNFQHNVNVFLDEFYLNYALDPAYENGEGEGVDELNIDDFPLAHSPPYGPELGVEIGVECGSEYGTKFGMEYATEYDPNYGGTESTTEEFLQASNTQLTEACVVQNMLRPPHSTYLRALTGTDLSYHLFPFAALVERNGVVRLLLTYLARCGHLLAALLAIAATFQFLRTSEKRHDVALQFYADVCVKRLARVFRIRQYSHNFAGLERGIERLLLTVLVMSTRFTATTTVQAAHLPGAWKEHLLGARDLLAEYLRIQLAATGKEAQMSSGLALARTWFFAIEASAAMHTAVGGALSLAAVPDTAGNIDSNIGNIGNSESTISPDTSLHAPSVDLGAEYHILVDTGSVDPQIHHQYHHALRRALIVCDIASPSRGTFNLYWGFTGSFLKPVLAFVSLTDAVKRRMLAHVPVKWTMHLLGLLDTLLQDRVAHGVCIHTFEIPATSRSHPDYAGGDRLLLPTSGYLRMLDVNRTLRVYSWFDASHQIHGDYLSLRVLVSHNFLALPRTHPSVQDVLRKFFAGAFFIRSKHSPQYINDKSHVLIDSENYYLCTRSFDIRCVMVQSMFRLVSGIVVDDLHFEMIELYFLGLLKLGNGSSLKSIDMVTRIRLIRAENAARLQGAPDEKIYDFYDCMNDIPFS